ncbi:MAG: CAP domain-containing protein [Clostridiales bacterium]|nr:CAP domain-containing protein [Clostridiales bacterium]
MKTKKINRTFKKFTAALLVLALCLGVVMTEGLTVAKAASNCVDVQFNVTYKQTDARSMLSLINDFRTGSEANYVGANGGIVTVSGLSELTYDYDLEKIAMQRAAEIVLSFEHTRPNGDDCWTAYTEYSYSYDSCGENIAWGYSSAQSVFEGWREDDEDYSGQGHRRNMLGDFSNVAIACASYGGKCCWVQEFSKASNTSAATTANNSITTVTVSVPQSDLTNISASDMSLTVGGTASLSSVTASYASDYNGTVKVTIPTTAWRVAGAGVISVSDDGTVMALSAGTALVTLTTALGDYDVTVTVKENSSTGSTGNNDDGSGNESNFAGDESEDETDITEDDGRGNGYPK